MAKTMSDFLSKLDVNRQPPTIKILFVLVKVEGC